MIVRGSRIERGAERYHGQDREDGSNFHESRCLSGKSESTSAFRNPGTWHRTGIFVLVSRPTRNVLLTASEYNVRTGLLNARGLEWPPTVSVLPRESSRQMAQIHPRSRNCYASPSDLVIRENPRFP